MNQNLKRLMEDGCQHFQQVQLCSLFIMVLNWGYGFLRCSLKQAKIAQYDLIAVSFGMINYIKSIIAYKNVGIKVINGLIA